MMEQVALSDQKKENIMELLENAGTQKRRKPSVKALVLAAALAAGCLISGAVAMRQPEFIPDFTRAVKITIEKDSIHFNMRGNYSTDWPHSTPIQLKNGRLWFINGKEYTDITDMIDEETPYVGVQTDPDTGEIIAFLALGGTPEDFGYIVAARYPEGSDRRRAIAGLNYMFETLTYNGVTYQFDSFFDLDELPDDVKEVIDVSTDDDGATHYVYPDGCYTTLAYKPWVVIAVKEIGIDWFENLSA